MAIQRRKFSEEDKIKILEEAKRMGITAALREHRLSYSVFARWKSKYAAGAVRPDQTRSELKHLTEENARLKKIIAQQALELERKEEELRKSNPLYGKR